jgi:DNA-binding CsgD family transcriptional regulator
VVDETMPALHPVQRRALEYALLIRDSEGATPEGRLLGLALVSVVQTLTADGPVLLAIDDAQWVDGSSADVLRFVLRRLGSMPVGVLATVRGRPVEAPFELERSFAQFRRLTVAPLSLGAIHSLLWDRLGLALPRPVLMRVHTATGGNPFFALELGRGIVDGTIRVDAEEISLPDSLLAVVEQRLSALPGAVAETLVAVAALSAPSVTFLEPFGATTVGDLEIAASRHVIEFDGDRIRFTHPLLAPACYALLPQHRRRQLHRRLADLDVDPEERARHLALATTRVDENIAAALDAAAVHARGRGAAPAAAELALYAVSLTPGLAHDNLARRRLAAARLSVDAGDTSKARSLLEDVVGSAPAGQIRTEAITALAEVRGLFEGNPIAIDLLLRALAEPGLEGRQKAMIYGALVNGSYLGEASLSYAEAGLTLAEEIGDPELLVYCLTAFADVTFQLSGQLRRDILERAVVLDQTTPGTPRLDPRVTLAYNLGRMEHFDESRAIWADLIAEGRGRDDPEVAMHLAFQARMEVSACNWGTARRCCDEAIELSRQTGREVTENRAQMVFAEIAAHRGEADPASILDLVRAAEPWKAHGGTGARLIRALASLLLSRGEPEATWTHLAPQLDVLENWDEGWAELAGSVGIEALVGIGDLEQAERLLAKLDHHAATAETALPFLAHRCRGLILEARGEHAAALAELEGAAALPEHPGDRNPLEQARTLLVLGRVHRKMQHKKAARDTLEQALEIFQRLGARTWADRTRSELGRIGGRRSSQSEFSETERRIVELVVAGRKNREVADELFLSPDTVAWNLSRVYKKLGVTSRTQLAARLAHDNDPRAAG